MFSRINQPRFISSAYVAVRARLLLGKGQTPRRVLLWSTFWLVITIGLGISIQQALADTATLPTAAVSAQLSPLHPTFVLLDANGVPVLTSGGALSTMRTCGTCHDTAFIASHSFHADLGLADFADPQVKLAQPWDSSRGFFGKWDPLLYRFLSPGGGGTA